MALSVVYSSCKNFTSIVIFYFSFNFAVEVFYMFNIKGFGLKKLPQRKGGDGKGQGHQGQSRMEPRVVLSALHGVA